MLRFDPLELTWSERYDESDEKETKKRISDPSRKRTDVNEAVGQ